MKKLIIVMAFLSSAIAYGSGSVYVHGYTRSNGTYVQPHYRSAPDESQDDNWTTRGNVNPYTGQEGTREPPPTYSTGNNYRDNGIDRDSSDSVDSDSSSD